MADKKLNVYELPEEWVLPFVAAWRTFEKVLNPAFSFHLRCAECGKMSNTFVKSVKQDKVVLGLQCKTKNCGQTIKFIGKLDPDAATFPKRLLEDRPPSALTSPSGDKAKASKKYWDTLTALLELNS